MRKGVTLIELLIVISILVILAVIFAMVFIGPAARARDSGRLYDSDRLRKNLEIYRSENDKYPESDEWKKLEDDAKDRGPFYSAMITYLKNIPQDPLYDKNEDYGFYYKTTNNGDCYKIHIEMEKRDPYEISGACGGDIAYVAPAPSGGGPSSSPGPSGGGASTSPGPSGGGSSPSPSSTPAPPCQLPPGYALSFAPGVDDRVHVPSSASLNITEDPGLTLEFCVKASTNGSSFKYVIDKCADDIGGYCYAFTGTSPAYEGVQCPTVVFGGDYQPNGMWLTWSETCQTGPDIGTWTHLAITYDSSHNLTMYKNGMVIDSGTLGSLDISLPSGGTPPSSPEPKILPSLPKDLDIGWNMKDAILDEVRIYAKALPPNLIAAHSASDYSQDSTGCSGSCDLRGAWHFDEGSGTTAIDSSGNGNTGTLINNPTWVSAP
ncbi:hypothetical protein A2362_03880 [Candidatus Curtissbacteria bacterium RIFOXYB1_FULL_41_59]|nr:MAG: hypothetical protein A3E14_04350 [Candidatus Curtissbacteria bacterium RIFCSPHIGHO2_12_FULL_41_13]OGE05830.1 MAG: hypothetical protein A2362_03880 [Candidatus Curtissbacteria bacterium RIFOXYB1_FULL_41_59]OGE07486.1 MAG: hypothetical protein A2615_03200 [Candidatus Curtissbacteria bacterium RIFOXYD1_FULL_41_36]OGE16068.1 MAG: hypothetical protein A2409_01165 [Candidatus Curtissbacteria bacterium RIFOXYC1_FULL_41_36]